MAEAVNPPERRAPFGAFSMAGVQGDGRIRSKSRRSWKSRVRDFACPDVALECDHPLPATPRDRSPESMRR